MGKSWRWGLLSLCVLVGFVAAQTRESYAPEDEPAPPGLSIDVSRDAVRFTGDVSSVAHESILRQRAETLFPDKTISYDLRERPALPPGWALLSELTLRAAEGSHTWTAEMSGTQLDIHGVTVNSVAWREGLARIEQHLLPGMSLQHQVSELVAAGSLEQQCQSLFRAAQRTNKVDFAKSDATLGTRVWPLLDELIQIATDCPGSAIHITGHTDNTGDESANLSLSEQRANAIAAYMIERGIAPGRIVTKGAGSSQPVAIEDTPLAHRRNRRIDIDLVF